MALNVATDPDQRFDLAVQLKKLDVAYNIACDTDNEARWNQIADLALANWKVYFNVYDYLIINIYIYIYIYIYIGFIIILGNPKYNKTMD